MLTCWNLLTVNIFDIWSTCRFQRCLKYMWKYGPLWGILEHFIGQVRWIRDPRCRPIDEMDQFDGLILGSSDGVQQIRPFQAWRADSVQTSSVTSRTTDPWNGLAQLNLPLSICPGIYRSEILCGPRKSLSLHVKRFFIFSGQNSGSKTYEKTFAWNLERIENRTRKCSTEFLIAHRNTFVC